MVSVTFAVAVPETTWLVSHLSVEPEPTNKLLTLHDEPVSTKKTVWVVVRLAVAGTPRSTYDTVGAVKPLPPPTI